MPDCKEIHQLVSESLDRPLSLREQTSLRLHLLICTACTNFSGQMRLIRAAMRQLPPADRDPPDPP